MVATVMVVGSGGGAALGAPPACNLVPQLRDLTINQGLGSYSPLAWGKDTLVRLYMSQPSCAPSGALIQVTGATLSLSGGGVANRTITGTTPALVSVFPSIPTYSAAPAVDSTGDVKFDAPGSTLSPAGTEAGFTATFTASVTYSAQASSRDTPTTGTVSFTTRPGTTTAITATVAKKTNALRVLVVPIGDATKLYNTQLTPAGQAEIQRGMLTLSRIYPVRDGVASLTDTTAAGLAAGLRYSVSPTLLNVGALMIAGQFCGNSSNFTTLRGLLAQFLQAFNSANPATPADRVLGVGDQVIVKGSTDGCDEGRAAVNGNEAWARLIYDQTGAPSRTGALMGMELAHTMGAVPAGRNDGGFHSLYTNADYLAGDLNRAFNIATRSVLAGTNDDHTVMRFVTPWDNTNTVLEKADWALLLCRLGGPTTSDCTTSGTVGTAAAGPAFVMSGTTSGSNGICGSCVGQATGTNVVESYFSNSMPQTRADPTSAYHLVQKLNGSALGAPFGNQGVPVTASDDTHHGSTSQTNADAGLFSVALPFDTRADRIELWKGSPGGSGSLLLYARNTSAAPTVTSMSSGSPIVLLRARGSATASKPPARAAKKPRRRTHASARERFPLSTSAALVTSFVVNDTGDGPDSNTDDNMCDDGTAHCTLRAAIQQANATAGADTITFNIGTGPQTIKPASPLPIITDPVTIDGTTQPGHGTAPIIELDGSSAGTASTTDGLDISAGGSTVRGLIVNRFAGSGIVLFTGSQNTVEGNFVGTDATGHGDAGNTFFGIAINGSGGNLIQDNVVSGNDGDGIVLEFAAASENDIRLNKIGTDVTGSSAVGNGADGIKISNAGGFNTVGGGASDRNVISGNANGVTLEGPNTGVFVQGNYIGLNAAGTAALPNTNRGIFINQSSHHRIGGIASTVGNVISGNGVGIDIFGSTSGDPSNQNIVENNLIGTDPAGTGAIPNTQGGIKLTDASVNTVGGLSGERNVIANNGGPGVLLNDLNSTGNNIIGNRIFNNTGLGIDLFPNGPTANDPGDTDSGPNNLQNFPVLSGATLASGQLTITGTLDTNTGLTNTAFRLEAFLSSACDGSTFGEGEFFVGASQVNVDASGHASFNLGFGTAETGTVATVTVTAAGTGDTSEFSACQTVSAGGGGGGPFVVNTTGDHDDGTCNATDCSLREAIKAANLHANGDGPDLIAFAIAGSGPQQISLNSQLPDVIDPVVIDGDSERTTGTSIPAGSKAIALNGVAAGDADGLVFASGSGGSDVKGIAFGGFHCAAVEGCTTGWGLDVESDGVTIEDNYIGLGPNGTPTAPNDGGIVVKGNGDIIGDDVSPPDNADPARGNVIVANRGPGILLQNATNAKVTGNFVGTTRTGTGEIGNFDGIYVSSGTGNTIGPGNTIADNDHYGINMLSAPNRVVANSIHDNGDVGIHNSPSVGVAQPTLTSAVESGGTTTVNGTVSGTAGTPFFIEFFKNTACDTSGAGEGETYIGFASATTNGAGSASYSFASTGLAVDDIVTATATNASVLSTSEFSLCRTVVSSTTPPGKQEFDVGGSDDNAHDDVLDLFLDCGPGKGKFPVALAVAPSNATNTTANWTYNYDASLACAGGQLEAVVNDGFRQSGFTTTGTEPVDSAQKPPFSAILSPTKGKTFLQYAAIPLKGLAFDAEDGAITPSWRLIRNSDNTTVRTATGTTADLSPGTSGWTPGAYTVELSATDHAGNTTTSTADITIVADADNDGIPASAEGGCLGGSDTNPLDAYGDKDGDGIPNGEDPDPCHAQSGAYTAIATFQPNPFPVPSSGNTVNVTIQVPYRNLTQVLSTSVAIIRINDDVVNFKSVSWKVTNNVGQALFDRQALANYFINHNIHNRTVLFTITGSSAAPPWSFQGMASTFIAG